MVMDLNRLRSAEIRQGRSPSRPITRLFAIATMILIRGLGMRFTALLYGDRCGDIRLGVIIQKLDVIERKVKDRTDIWIQFYGWQGARRAT